MPDQMSLLGDAPEPTETDTLSKARLQVEHLLDHGSHCPCCGQYCKVYRRKFTSEMAAWLIWMYRDYATLTKWRYGCNHWVDVKRYSLRGGDYAKTAYWGLAERKPKDPEDTSKRTSGLWKPTVKGEHFVQQRISIPSHAFVYNNEVKWFSDSKVDIVQALGNKFDYEELMNR
jgi:hypothetical protein